MEAIWQDLYFSNFSTGVRIFFVCADIARIDKEFYNIVNIYSQYVKKFLS